MSAKVFSFFLTTICFLTISVNSAFACTGVVSVAPGETVVPCENNEAPGTLLASKTEPYTFAVGVTGEVSAAVFDRDPGPGVLLDFYYQVITNSADAFDTRVTNSVFISYNTSVFYRTDGGSLPGGVFIDGVASPTNVDRSVGGGGSVVGFNFSTPELSSASPTYLFVIRTNATRFESGRTAILNGVGGVNIVTYQPVPFVQAVDLVNAVSPGGTLPPGTDLTYTATFTNSGTVNVRDLEFIDPIPNDTDFKLGSASTSLGSTGLVATITYSNNGGATYTYTPVSGGGGALVGYDRLVTQVRFFFLGTLIPAAPDNRGSFSLVARIR